MKFYIGIDNGVSGTIGIIERDEGVCDFFKTPVKSEQNYTKVKANISRINSPKLIEKLSMYCPGEGIRCLALIERPLVNPARFTSTVSALRSFEATLVVLENLKIPFQYIDSKEWQKDLLPKGTTGTEELKRTSKDIGRRLFPEWVIESHPDMDGLLMAEYARRKNL